MKRRKAKEKQIRQQMGLNPTGRTDYEERPDIGRPTIFLSKRDKQRNRKSKQGKKALHKALEEG